jgi:hypothetical protein
VSCGYDNNGDAENSGPSDISHKTRMLLVPAWLNEYRPSQLFLVFVVV